MWKAQEAVTQLPISGTVLITVAEYDRPAVGDVARQFSNLGFKIIATAGTHAFLSSQGVPSVSILAKGIAAYREGKSDVRSLQKYHADIK
jgi:carbamoyl-phosphate synthase large subunit